MESWLEELQERVQSTQANTVRDWLLWRFSLLRENPYLAAFAREREIQIMLRQFRERHASSLFPREGIDGYTTAFLQGGLDSATARWITGGMKESPEEMADELFALMRAS